MTIMDSIVAVYRGFRRFARWYGRLVTSAVTGIMAAMLVFAIGARLAVSHNRLGEVACVVALPLGIAVFVISYKFLRPSN